MRLLDRAAFEFRESDFPVDAQNPCSLLAGEPAEGRPVRMLRGPSGRAWRAQRAGHQFTVTVEDGHDEVLSGVLRQCSRLPLPYLAALEIVSEAGEDGLALYQSLGGAAGHGGENYVIVINSSLPLLLHEFGHAIEQQARNQVHAAGPMEGGGAPRPRRPPPPYYRPRYVLPRVLAMCMGPIRVVRLTARALPPTARAWLHTARVPPPTAYARPHTARAWPHTARAPPPTRVNLDPSPVAPLARGIVQGWTRAATCNRARARTRGAGFGLTR